VLHTLHTHANVRCNKITRKKLEKVDSANRGHMGFADKYLGNGSAVRMVASRCSFRISFIA